MTLPTLSAMQAFLSLARHLSFSKAALERGVSTSALSHALRDLEATLGVRLVNRTNRSVALTAAGEFFRVRSAAAVAEVEHAMAGIGAFRDRPVGTLRLNVPRSAADIIIRPMMATFLQRYPEIRLDIVSDDRLVDIVAEGFDAGIREGRLLAQDMIAVPVGPLMRFAVVGSPDYFATRPRPSAPRDLLSHSCICRRFPNGTAYPWTFGRGANVTTVDVSGSLVLDDRALIVAAALGRHWSRPYPRRPCRGAHCQWGADTRAGQMVSAATGLSPLLPRSTARSGAAAGLHRHGAYAGAGHIGRMTAVHPSKGLDVPGGGVGAR